MSADYKRTKEVCKIFSISKSTLYRYAKNPKFPKPLKPSPAITLWDVEEIKKYFEKVTSEIS